MGRPSSTTWRRRSPAPKRSSTGSTRSPRSSPTRTPTTTRCWPRWATCRPTSTMPTPGTSTPRLDQAMDALRCPPPDATGRQCSPGVSGAGSRCASCCCSSPTCCCSTSRPTTSTPRACSGSSSTSRRTRAPSSPSPTTGTSSTTSPSWILELDRGRAHPYEGNYSTYLETKAARLDVEGRKDAKRRQDARAGAGVGPLEPEGAAGQEQGAARRATRSWPPRRSATARSTSTEINIPAGPRLGDVVLEATG